MVFSAPDSRRPSANLVAVVYVVVVVSLVFASVAVFATLSGAFGSGSTTSQATSSFAPAPGVPVAHAVRVLRTGDFELQIQSLPRRLGQAAQTSVKLLRGVHVVNSARVRLTFSMPDMPEMHRLSTLLRQTAPGLYAHASPPLTIGRWRATFQVTPPHSTTFRTSFSYHISV
jgi:hypothetical protein